MPGFGVDPGAPFEAGKGFSGGGGRVELRVGCVVKDDLGHAGVLAGLRLARDVGVDHGVGHEAHERVGDLFAGVVVLDVLGEGVGVGEHVVEALALIPVLLRGERLTVAEEEPRDGAVAAFDDISRPGRPSHRRRACDNGGKSLCGGVLQARGRRCR